MLLAIVLQYCRVINRRSIYKQDLWYQGNKIMLQIMTQHFKVPLKHFIEHLMGIAIFLFENSGDSQSSLLSIEIPMHQKNFEAMVRNSADGLWKPEPMIVLHITPIIFAASPIYITPQLIHMLVLHIPSSMTFYTTFIYALTNMTLGTSCSTASTISARWTFRDFCLEISIVCTYYTRNMVVIP